MAFKTRQLKGSSLIRAAVIIVFALIQNRCANESVPQGGKQDQTPPEVTKAAPPSKSVNFKSDKIKITFDEFLKSTGFTQILISPPMDKKPDFILSGKTITIKLKSKLRDNTTYTINFAEDIKDLNEGNTLNNFTYVFSTGPYIDSQSISGDVVLAKDNSPAENVVVALYPKDSIDGILNSKPFYFAKTDKAGSFAIENIKAGKYSIYALKDQNYNYLYDQSNEMIAFVDSAVNLEDSVSSHISLVLFEEANGKVQLDQVKTIAPGHLQLSFTKPISTLKINSDITSTDDFTLFNITNDTIDYWFSKYYITKTTLFTLVNDSLRDTTRMELKYIPKDSLAANPKYFLSIENQAITSKTKVQMANAEKIEDLYKPLKINFTRPIIEINENKRLSITRDSAVETTAQSFVLDQKTKQSIQVDFLKRENSTYIVEIPDSIFRDIFGMWNRRMTYTFRTGGKDLYGNLRVTLKTDHPENSYIVKLLDANNETVKQFLFSGNNESKVSFETIPAGSYKFLVIEDRNRNGKWDTGDFKNKIQPEKMFTYKDTYQLKGGWDLDVQLKF